jgi:hypothetical protein
VVGCAMLSRPVQRLRRSQTSEGRESMPPAGLVIGYRWMDRWAGYFCPAREALLPRLPLKSSVANHQSGIRIRFEAAKSFSETIR